MEVVLATLLPCAVLIALSRRRSAAAEERRAALILTVLTLLWFAPCWATRSTPISLDFLTQSPPWSPLRPAGYLDKNLLLNDPVLQFLPWHESVRRQVLDGELPFAGRFAGGTQPLWANPQVALLFPTTLVGLLFSTFGWALLSAVTKTLAALWGTWLFLRHRGLSSAASIFGAIAYGFGAFTMTYLAFPHTNVTTLLPLLLLAIDLACQRPGWRAAAGGAAVLFLMVAGGHPESVLHCAFVALPYAALRLWQCADRGRAVARLAALGVVGLLLAAPLLLPFRAYLPHSQRVGDIATQPGMLSTPPFEWRSFVPFAVPNYFGNPRVHNYRHGYNYNEMAAQYAGLVTLVLALAILAAQPRRHRFWGLLLALFVLLSIEPLWLYEGLKSVPILGITAHSRLRFAVGFILAVLGAEGYEALLKRDHRGTIAAGALVAFVGVAIFCVASYPLFAQYGIRRLIFFTEAAALLGSAITFFAARAFNPSLARALPALLFLDLFSVVGLYNPANGRELAYPKTPEIEALRTLEPSRFAAVGLAMQPNTAAFFGLEDIRVHDPMAFQPYVALLDAAGFDRSKYFGEFHALPPRVLIDFLGVRRVLAGRDVAVALPLALDGKGARVYDNPAALPRYFVPRAIVPGEGTPRQVLALPEARTVIAAQEHPLAPAVLTVAGYGQNGAVVDVRNQADTFVASSEVAVPGWRLTRDGAPWPIDTVNGVFVGWKVPAGGGRFELRYRPQQLGAGFAGACVGLVCLALMLARPMKAKSEGEEA